MHMYKVVQECAHTFVLTGLRIWSGADECLSYHRDGTVKPKLSLVIFFFAILCSKIVSQNQDQHYLPSQPLEAKFSFSKRVHRDNEPVLSDHSVSMACLAGDKQCVTT